MRDDRSCQQVFLSLEPVQDPEAVCVNECSCVIVWVGSDCCLCSFVRSQKERYEQFLLLAQNQDQMLKKLPNVSARNWCNAGDGWTTSQFLRTFLETDSANGVTRPSVNKPK